MKVANGKTAKHFLVFGAFSIDVTDRVLNRQGKPVSLTPKAFDTLLALAENAGRILDKDELMKTVWPDTVVEENNLTQAISALRKAFGEDPAAPSYIETLPRRGYRFVAEVTERQEEIPQLYRKDPKEQDRPSEIGAEPTETPVSADGERLATVVEVNEARPIPGRWITLKLVVVAAALLAVTVFAAYYFWLGKQSQDRFGGFKHRRSVAVLGLKNLSQRPDAAWLSTALSEMLTTELSAGDGLMAIPGENIARMKRELPLADTDSLAQDTLKNVRKDLGVDYVVLGAYTDLGKESGGRIRLDLRVQDAAGGGTVVTVGETGTEANLFDLVSRTGAVLRSRLGLADVPPGEAGAVRASLPSNPDATELYSEGLDKLRALDFLNARDLLEKAVARDPQYPVAHSFLAAAWSSLGYDAKAKEEARKALDLSAGLSREQQLVIEGRLREIEDDWGKAASTYRTLFGLFPDNLEYGLRLATAQTFASQNADAETTLSALRRLPPPARDDARIDLEEAALNDALPNFQREQEAASSAAKKGRAQGARLLVARALVMEGRALWKLGRPQEAAPAFTEAQQIFSLAGDQEGLAEAVHTHSEMLVDAGDLSGARKGYEQALAIHRQTGDQGGVAANLNDIAQILWMQSDLSGAQRMYDQSIAAFREVGDRHGEADVLNNIANILYNQGNLARAADMYNQALAVFRQIGDQEGTALALANVGLIFYTQGDLDGAQKSYKEALSISRAAGAKSESAQAYYGLGEIAADRGDLDQARKWHEQALSLREEIGEKATASESQLDLASIALDQGRAGDAEAASRSAAAEFEREDSQDDEALAQALLARALLAQDKLAEARESAARASGLARQSNNRGARLVVAITAARIEAASGGPAGIRAAVRNLQTEAAEAAKLGFFHEELEARLATGELQLKSGPAAGRATLDGLKKDAEARGYGRVAHLAAEAMAGK